MTTTLDAYLRMLQDPVRLPAYGAAIAAAVRPGDVVLDLGSGLGTMAFLALEAGAAHVYAVELDDVVELGRLVTRRNGYEDRVTTIRGDSRRLELPRPADVLLCDLRGALPLFGDHLQVIADARDRLLKPGGRLVPQADTLYVAPVACPAGHARVAGWRGPLPGADYAAAAALAANHVTRQRLEPEAPLAPGQPLARIDYATWQDADLRLTARYVVERAGVCDGLGAWFEAELAPGVRLSTAPDAPETLYQQAHLPLSEGYPVRPGDVVTADVRAVPSGEDWVFLWRVAVEAAGRPRAEEEHSTFRGFLPDPARLKKGTAGATPDLDEDGRIDALILGAMDGRTPLAAIARRVAERYPGRFATWQEALGRVARLAEQYGA